MEETRVTKNGVLFLGASNFKPPRPRHYSVFPQLLLSSMFAKKNKPQLTIQIHSSQSENQLASCNIASSLQRSEYSEIIPGLYVGTDVFASDLQQLRKFGVTHIVNCASHISPNYFPDQFKYKSLSLPDCPAEDIREIFDEVITIAIQNHHSELFLTFFVSNISFR